MNSKVLLPLLVIALFPLSAQALLIDTYTQGEATTLGGVETSVDVSADADERTDPNQVLMTTTSTDVTVMYSQDVKSDADLSLFTESITSANTNVDTVTVHSDNTLAVTYKHKVKLFGFIPVTLHSETRVFANADGNAEVVTSLPWWKVFVIGGSDIAVDVDAALESSTAIKNYVSASANASANVKAQAAEVVVATLNAKAGVALLAQ